MSLDEPLPDTPEGEPETPADDSARRRMLALPGVPGLTLALIFAWQSFSPTLMPRTWVAQAAITGLCLALGYMIGTFLGYLGKRFLLRRGAIPSDQVVRGIWIALAVGAAIVLLFGLFAWPAWQNDQRDLLAMDHLSRVQAVPMLVVALVLAVVLGFVGRAIGRGVGWLNRVTHRHLPASLATPLTVVLIVVLVGVIGKDAISSRFASWANSAFGIIDTSTSDGTVQPTSPLVSGSPASLAPWDTLGRQGRDFVAQATTLEELAAFHDADADLLEPIRVYTGLRSADSAQARAALAVDELERTGGFDREVLVVTTVTGTGWVDPDAALAVEMLHGGDTAIVAMQYSYLPSWISTLVDDGNATEAGAVLFDTVYDSWRALPEGGRPRLIVFGQSLGSYGAEAAFAGVEASTSIANMVTRSDGVLFTGPTNDNLVWRQLTQNRDQGSPVWKPMIDGGTSVRFANTVAELVELDPNWDEPRILYVQHPSDPVTFWSMDTLWSKPEWMNRPRGADVPARGGWLPVVTWTQGLFDMAAGFGAPPGHGHDYRLAFAGAWSQVVPPEGWTSADAARLSAFLNAD